MLKWIKNKLIEDHKEMNHLEYGYTELDADDYIMRLNNQELIELIDQYRANH